MQTTHTHIQKKPRTHRKEMESENETERGDHRKIKEKKEHKLKITVVSSHRLCAVCTL